MMLPIAIRRTNPSPLRGGEFVAMRSQDSSNFARANCSPPPASQREAMMVAVAFSPRNTRRARHPVTARQLNPL